MKNLAPFGLLFIFFLFGNIVGAQTVYRLWEETEKPHYKENNLKEYEKELWGTLCLLNITNPTLTVYKAKGENTGKAVVIIPGGGYEMVAIHHEGYDVAEKLSANGITAAVLKYRLPSPETSEEPHLVPLTDTRRALVLLRSMSGEYGFNREKVGVMGFSAGSHLATVASLWKSDREEENPNFSALIYGVTNLSDANLKWLEESLYYRKLTDEEVNQNQLLNLVSADTPPAFLVHAYDDDVCFVEETTLYAQQLYQHNILAEVHLFAKGGHGFGLGSEEDGTGQWINLFINWVRSNEL
ncbi:alpha/beta hydrolase [Muriicola sp. Z0-33]|uniref:alpha/beta hydrolase n=1 Tax=Muriicola sp. Z0-33 TaxID=2816957 RepID=UPI002238CF40|nr:alpha/beta hydrolase [Muriicola sp. Z0-33]MCW5516026.1 alpha/beta hydrolase [Muriicola sp. Z0-33]